VALIGLVRVSTDKQKTQRRHDALDPICLKVFEEKISGKLATDDRPALLEALAYIRDGDMLCVQEADRLGHNLLEGLLVLNDLLSPPASRSPSESSTRPSRPLLRATPPTSPRLPEENAETLPHIPLDNPCVLTLAKARQQFAHDCTYLPTWEEPTDKEREGALPDSRNYLESAINAGLVPAVEPIDSGRRANPTNINDEIER
jgi:hypothetical protein